MTTAPISPRFHRLGSELRQARIQELEALERQRYTGVERLGFLTLLAIMAGFGAALAIVARMVL